MKAMYTAGPLCYQVDATGVSKNRNTRCRYCQCLPRHSQKSKAAHRSLVSMSFISIVHSLLSNWFPPVSNLPKIQVIPNKNPSRSEVCKSVTSPRHWKGDTRALPQGHVIAVYRWEKPWDYPLAQSTPQRERKGESVTNSPLFSVS